MSLTPRSIVQFVVVSLAALTLASCGQQPSPTAPSSVMASAALQPGVTEYWVTLFDAAPEPTAVADEPPIGVPAPAPPPEPRSAPVPWPPGPPPLAAPGVPVPTPPSTHFRLRMKIDPEPVVHSGTPVGIFSCRDLRYTWYYDQYLHAETGIAVTFTGRDNFFDGRFVGTNTATIQLAGNGTVILHTRWCSAFAKPHYAQTRFKGKDENGEAITISGPWVRLLTP